MLSRGNLPVLRATSREFHAPLRCLTLIKWLENYVVYRATRD